MIKDEGLKAIGKQLKRDITAAVAQGKLPPRRYAVRTEHQLVALSCGRHR